MPARVNEAPVFRLAPGVRLRRSASAAELLVPEGIVTLSDTAAAVVELLDGKRDVATIAEHLSARFEAPPEALSRDVRELLEALAERGFVRP